MQTFFFFENASIYECRFPETLNYAEITPVLKEVDETGKANYRPINVLPSISILSKKSFYAQIEKFMDNRLSSLLCGFRKSIVCSMFFLISCKTGKKF